VNNAGYPSLTTAGISTFAREHDCRGLHLPEFQRRHRQRDELRDHRDAVESIGTGAKGATVRNCTFLPPGRRSQVPEGSPEQVVYIQVGGSVTAQILASGCVVTGNTLRGDCDATQISPLAGISLAMTQAAVVSANNLDTFHGKCVYIDTGANYQASFTGNSAPRCSQLRFADHSELRAHLRCGLCELDRDPQHTRLQRQHGAPEGAVELEPRQVRTSGHRDDAGLSTSTVIST